MSLITCGWLTPGRRFHVWGTPPRTEPPASTPCLCGAALAPRAKDLPDPPAEPAGRVTNTDAMGQPEPDQIVEIPDPPARVLPVLDPVPHDAIAAEVMAEVAAEDTAAAAGCHTEHPPAEPFADLADHTDPAVVAAVHGIGQPVDEQAAALFTGLDESPVSLPPEVRPEPTVITEGRIRGVSVDAVPGPAGGRVVTRAADPAPEVTRTGSAVPTARERWFVLALDENEAQQWRDRQGEGGRHRDAYILLTDVHPDGQGGCAFLEREAITPLDHIVRCRLNEQGVYYDEVITALHLAQERGKA